MKLNEIRDAESRLLVATYERTPVQFVRGEGVYLFDENGTAYLDMLSGIGVNALGYGHPAIQNAIDRQSRKLLHISNLFFHEGQADLAARLTEITGMDRVFFCNSGTEAWETALKLARAHSALLRSEGRRIGTKIIALEHSFHGRTSGSVSTTHKLKYREPFEPLVPGIEFVRFDDVADLKAKFSEEVCAIGLEPVQGEGGVRPVSKEFIQTARELTRNTGALLLADEIQSGMGRTGAWCAYQHYGILPDVTTLAKPLGGGIPIGAMVCTDEAARAFTPGSHGTTFGGGPLACAVAIAVIDTIRNDRLLGHVRETGAYFVNGLGELAHRHESIKEIRGAGLMIGVEMANVETAKQAASAMLERKIVLNRTNDTVLRFLPPYIVQQQHIDQTLQGLDEVLTEIATVPSEPAAATQGVRG